MKKLGLVSLVSSSVVFSDIASKLAVIASIEVGSDIPIIKNIFSLTHHHNVGVAFGFLSNIPSSFRIFLISSIAVCAIILILVMIRATEKKAENIALAMILGGAFGNLANRLWLGHVTDFIDFHWRYSYHFPAFNIADIAICLGVGILLFLVKHKNKNSYGSKVIA